MVSRLKALSYLLPVILLIACTEETENPIIEADFELATKFPKIFNHVEFDNLPDGSLSYEWDFGNGTTSNEKYPELVIFKEPKTYSVSLTTTSLGGTKSAITKEIAIGAYYIKNLTIIPEPGLQEKIQDAAKVKMVILQRKDSELVPVFEKLIFESSENLNSPKTVAVENVSFGGWARSYLGYPIIRLVDENSGEVLVDTEYANLGKFQFKSEENSGKSVIYPNIYNPSGFEFEFYYSNEIE